MNYDRLVISARERELLLLRGKTGDPDALNALFESCRKRLYCQAMQILTRPQDAEDAVQEAMVAAYANLHRFQGRADFLTWATRIVINAALQQIRRTRTRPTVSWDQVDTEFGESPFSEYFRDSRPTPEEQLHRRERREMLKDALHKLPPPLRQAMQLCKSADLPLKEAASALGPSLPTLKVRLHRGRRLMAVHVKRKTQIRNRRNDLRATSFSQKDVALRHSICPKAEEVRRNLYE